MKRPPGADPPDRAVRDAILGPAAPASAGAIDLISNFGSASFGRYEIVASIGRGGMGEVYLARRRHKKPFRLVALKVLLTDESGDEDLVAMFMDEASIMAQIHHPNVLEVFDFGREDHRYYLAMEYLAGRPLVRVMIDAYAKESGLDPRIVAAIGAQAARGLHAAHTATGKSGQPLEVVHRDVSPQNLFVTYPGVCKVLDFGVARAAERLARTTVGQLKGKAAYMSPEQVHGHVVDRRSDVFALGICLWEMSAGRRLFKRDNEWETMTAVVSGTILAPTVVRGGTETLLDKIILRALARDPDKRFDSAGELADKLESFVRTLDRNPLEGPIQSLMSRLYGTEAEKEQGLIAQLTSGKVTPEEVASLRELSGLSPRPTGFREITLAGAPEALEQLEHFGEKTDPGPHPPFGAADRSVSRTPTPGPEAIQRAIAVLYEEQEKFRRRKDSDKQRRKSAMRRDKLLRQKWPLLALALIIGTSAITVLIAVTRGVGRSDREPALRMPALAEDSIDLAVLRLDPISVVLSDEDRPIDRARAQITQAGLSVEVGVDRLAIRGQGSEPPVLVAPDAEAIPVQEANAQGLLLLSRRTGAAAITWVGSAGGEPWSARALSVNDCPAAAKALPEGIELSYDQHRVLLPHGGGVLETVVLERPQFAERLEVQPLGLAFGKGRLATAAVPCETGWDGTTVRLERLPPGRYNLLWMGERVERTDSLVVPSPPGDGSRRSRKAR